MKNILLGTLLLISSHLSAQEKNAADTQAVKTIDGIMKEVFSIISGEKGKKRDWDAFRNLFLPTTRFTVLNHDDTFPQPVETATLEELIELMHDPYYDAGFEQYGIGKIVDEYNGIAQVFQSYYGKDSENYEERGIGSYQLVYFDDRWWIVNVLWTGDSNGVEIPSKYLDN